MIIAVYFGRLYINGQRTIKYQDNMWLKQIFTEHIGPLNNCTLGKMDLNQGVMSNWAPDARAWYKSVLNKLATKIKARTIGVTGDI